MRVLYLTNYPVPYRVEFFNQLSEKCDLTVFYQDAQSAERNHDWQKSVDISHKCFLPGTSGLLKHLASHNYDLVVVGCYNEWSGIQSILLLKTLKKKYFINVDGEFFGGRGLKKMLRNPLAKGASGYLIAGENTGNELIKLVGANHIYRYHFSSLTRDELQRNARRGWREGDAFLCVGQFADYKGLDVLIDAMVGLPGYKLTMVGAADKADSLLNYIHKKGANNVDVVPFLKKDDLNKLYCDCRALILPSRQECWGLVVNEAASFGTPIIATSGVGAAADFLDSYSPLRPNPCDPLALREAIAAYLQMTAEEKMLISRELVKRSSRYSIERTVEEHIEAFQHVLREEQA